MNLQHANGDVFEHGCDAIEVTSLKRPDTSWRFTDAQGHEHQWCVGGHPATSYNPSAKHETPTLIWVKDGEEYYDDEDEPHAIGHHECARCGEHVTPRHTADENRVFVPGMRWCRINGESVTPDEYMRRWEETRGVRTLGS